MKEVVTNFKLAICRYEIRYLKSICDYAKDVGKTPLWCEATSKKVSKTQWYVMKTCSFLHHNPKVQLTNEEHQLRFKSMKTDTIASWNAVDILSNRKLMRRQQRKEAKEDVWKTKS